MQIQFTTKQIQHKYTRICPQKTVRANFANKRLAAEEKLDTKAHVLCLHAEWYPTPDLLHWYSLCIALCALCIAPNAVQCSSCWSELSLLHCVIVLQRPMQSTEGTEDDLWCQGAVSKIYGTIVYNPCSTHSSSTPAPENWDKFLSPNNA